MDTEVATYPGISNQDVVNAFWKAIGEGYWEVIEKAGLTALAVPASNRDKRYTGEKIEKIETLTGKQQDAIRRELEV